MDSAQMHFCRDLFLVAARDGVKAEARKAKQRERSGQPRGLSEEYESILRSVTEKPVPGAGTARKGILSDDDLLDEDEDEDWEEDEPADGSAGDAQGGNAADADAPVPVRQVDKDVIAAADAAGAELPVEQQHAEAGEHLDEPVGHDEPVDAAAEKKPAAVAAEPEREQRPDAIVPAVADEQPVDAPFRRQKRSVDDDDAVAKPRRRTKRSKPLGNSAFEAARIIVNPRCVTTYAGVSHTQLALDLFGSGDDKEPAPHEGGKYALEEWSTAPETFVRARAIDYG